ncbi:MAG: hypothetical protein GY835_11090 [bacterium]|nr:hypothetical protein [bacterium]
MDFPRDNNALNKLYEDGVSPVIAEFTGDYWVQMLTGPVPDFRWARHEKRFTDSLPKTGVNIVLGIFRFGRFKVATTVCADYKDLQAVELNYGARRNLLTRPVRDKLRRLDEGVYLGRWYSRNGDGERFRGYFSLIRK